MMATYTVTGERKKFKHGGAALEHAKRKYPEVVWGSWHQGTDGRMRIVGKVPGGVSDPIIVQAK
jgi:hypothetical protein